MLRVPTDEVAPLFAATLLLVVLTVTQQVVGLRQTIHALQDVLGTAREHALQSCYKAEHAIASFVQLHALLGERSRADLEHASGSAIRSTATVILGACGRHRFVPLTRQYSNTDSDAAHCHLYVPVAAPMHAAARRRQRAFRAG